MTLSCSSAVEVARLSGSSVSSGTIYTLSTGYLQIVFSSDSSVARPGFIAQWHLEGLMGGGGCTECVVGSYKADQGNANCQSCPANSDSPAGSIIVTACTCNAGWTGLDNKSCKECVAGTYNGPWECHLRKLPSSFRLPCRQYCSHSLYVQRRILGR